MTTTPPPICVYCSRLSPTGFSCDAYPDGIPNALTLGGADHRLPLAGDGGIVFRPRNAKALAAVRRDWGDEPVAYAGPMRIPNPAIDGVTGV